MPLCSIEEREAGIFDNIWIQPASGDAGGALGAALAMSSTAIVSKLLTERLELESEHGRRITLQGQPELEPANVVVPADPSSAAFPLVAALITPGSDLILEAVVKVSGVQDGAIAEPSLLDAEIIADVSFRLKARIVREGQLKAARLADAGSEAAVQASCAEPSGSLAS